MTCEKVMSLVSAHMDRELGYDELREVELHLADCEACRMEYGTLKATKGLVGTLKEAELPRDFWPELRRKLGAGSPRALRPRSGAFLPPLARMLAPALLVVVLVAVPLVWNAHRKPAGTQAQSLADTLEPYFRDYIISEYDRPLSDKTSVGFVATAQAVTMYAADRLQLVEPPEPVMSAGSAWDAYPGLVGATGVGYTVLSAPK